jgi:hypothetical protein
VRNHLDDRISRRQNSLGEIAEEFYNSRKNHRRRAYDADRVT